MTIHRERKRQIGCQRLGGHFSQISARQEAVSGCLLPGGALTGSWEDRVGGG